MVIVLSRGIGTFFCCLAFHVLIWRVFDVRRQTAWLTSIFLFAPGIILGSRLIYAAFGQSLSKDPRWLIWCLAYLLHVSLSGAYLFLYTGVAGFSPTIAILENVAQNMPRGLKEGKLAPSWFNDETLSGRRHQNLLSTGLISESAGHLHLNSRGRLIAEAFLILRRFLGLPDVAKG